MAGIIIVAAAVGVQKTHNKIQQRRSPLLQLPSAAEAGLTHITSDASDEPQTPDKAPSAVTEFTLVKFHRRWLSREIELAARMRAMLLAKRRGADRCWAGPLVMFDALAAAKGEATFIRERFEDAINWCEERKMKRTNWAFALGLKRNGSLRKQHDEVPPALYFVPLPFPRPPGDNDYSLVMTLPPALGSTEVDPPPAPPVYSEKVADDEELMQRTERDEEQAGPSS